MRTRFDFTLALIFLAALPACAQRHNEGRPAEGQHERCNVGLKLMALRLRGRTKGAYPLPRSSASRMPDRSPSIAPTARSMDRST